MRFRVIPEDPEWAVQAEVAEDLLNWDFEKVLAALSKLQRRRMKIDHARVIELAREGQRVDEIAEQVGASQWWVYGILRKGLSAEEWKLISKMRKRKVQAPRNPERDQKMAEMRGAGKTLREIGEVFEICGERVRQRLKQLRIEKPEIEKPEKEPLFPGSKVVKGWLYAAGYRRCRGECKEWKPLSEFSSAAINPSLSGRCKSCNSKYQKKLWQEKHEHMLKMARARYRRNPEKAAETQRLWIEKNREYVNAKQPQKYLRRKG
jgi:hypothetical protein